MNGCAIPYTPIAVDFWKTRQCPRVKFFFLSHGYVDQTCGLSHSWSMPIYCSSVTRNILLSKFSIRPEVVHGLELNVQHTICLCNGEEACIRVTLVDSNYCPGSVMFFFEGYFGRILYTGSFRFNEAAFVQTPLRDLLKIPVDVLYLDNTYCNSKCVFPTKEAALETIREIIERHKKGKILVALKTFGKEELLVCLSKHFKERIKVNDERMKVLEILKEDKNFTANNFVSTSIDVIPFSDIFQKTNYDVSLMEPSVCIVPTGLFTALGYNPFENQSNVFVVPYSNHSSYSELIKFVSFVRPKSIVPVNKPVSDPVSGALMDRSNIDCFQEFLNKSPMHHYHIPQSVLKVMNQSSVHKRRMSKSNLKKTRKQSEPIFVSNYESLGSNTGTTKNTNVRRVSASPYLVPTSISGSVGGPLSRPSANCSNHPFRRISLTTPQPVKIPKRCKSVGSFVPVEEHSAARSCQRSNFIDLNLTPLIANINFYQSSNLVRCHRARLCIPEQCETVCHPRNILESYSASCNAREQSDRTGHAYIPCHNSSTLLEHTSREYIPGSLDLQLLSRLKCDHNSSSKAPFENNHSCNRDIPSRFEMLPGLERHQSSPPRMAKRSEDRIDESFQATELPPKKKWCNMFNTSQLETDAPRENAGKPVPRRRMGTTANPIDFCLNSIARVPASCLTSSSSDHVILSNVSSNLMASPVRSAVQRNCGHSMKFMHIHSQVGVNPNPNFCSSVSPIDLSVSKN